MRVIGAPCIGRCEHAPAALVGWHPIDEATPEKIAAAIADKRIEAVTAADVQRVAKQYFTPKNRTIATLIPEKPEVKQ